MILDGIPFAEGAKDRKRSKNAALGAVVGLLERKLGVRVLYDLLSIPFGRPQLAETAEIAEKLRRARVLESLSRVSPPPSEPQTRIWRAVALNKEHTVTGGMSVGDDEAAMRAAIAECLERYLWYTADGYFMRAVRATLRQMRSRDAYIDPGRFVSFLQAERDTNPALRLDPEAPYLWIQGVSLVSGRRTYVPAQTVSATIRPTAGPTREPLIRAQTTTGLAVWPTQAGARLAGALELIERDAYLIWWLNQLILPQIDVEEVAKGHAPLRTLLGHCTRYGLAVYALRMPTDAPTYAVNVVIEDLRGHTPRFAFGLKVHRSLGTAIEKAALEALRARINYHVYFDSTSWDPHTPVEHIGHQERMAYWALPEHAKQLEPLIAGPIETPSPQAWDNDTDEQHLERIVAWCRHAGFECVSISLGTSKANVTPWHVEEIVIPELQPTYLEERHRHLGGARLVEIPRRFGYAPREKPYTDGPHPFV